MPPCDFSRRTLPCGFSRRRRQLQSDFWAGGKRGSGKRAVPPALLRGTSTNLAITSSSRPWICPPVSSFDPAQGDALDEGLLREEEEDQRRDGDQHGRRVEQLPLASVVAQEGVEAHGQGKLALVVEID